MNKHARGEADASTVKEVVPGTERTGTGGFDPRAVREIVEASFGTTRFVLEPLDGIELDTSPQWLIPGLMPATGLHVLYGAPGAGKSFLALSAALHVAAGKTWAGRPVRQGGVVYVAAEGGRGFRKRVFAARAAMGDDEDVRFALVTTAPDLGRKGDTTELIDQIRTQAGRFGWKPRLVVVDTLSRSVADMDESSSQDIMRFVGNAEAISDAFGCVVMPVHHTGKDESKGMRGSSALHGSADAEWLVSRPGDGGPRVLSVEKMKDGSDKARLRYDLVDVDLGVDSDGQRITTCVAKVFEGDDEPVGVGRELRGKGRFSQDDMLCTILKLLVANVGEPSPEGSTLGRGKIITRTRFHEAVASTGMFAALSPKALTTATDRAFRVLVKRGRLSKDAKQLCLLDHPTED